MYATRHDADPDMYAVAQNGGTCVRWAGWSHHNVQVYVVDALAPLRAVVDHHAKTLLETLQAGEFQKPIRDCYIKCINVLMY